MSRTIGSPARMTRSDASWCGDAEFGPDPTIANMRLVVALGDEPLADLARHVRFGPPDQPAGRDLRHDPVGGVRGRAAAARSRRVLDHPQVAQDGRGELEVGAPSSAAWRRSRCSAGIVSETATPAVRREQPARRPREAYGVVGLVPGRRSSTGVRRPASAGAALEAGHDDERLPRPAG